MVKERSRVARREDVWGVGRHEIGKNNIYFVRSMNKFMVDVWSIGKHVVFIVIIDVDLDLFLLIFFPVCFVVSSLTFDFCVVIR